MKRWIILCVLILLAGVGFWFTWLRPTPPKRFILIICDAMRADHLGCYGDRQKVTPNIDAFAARSLLFKNAYSVAPWTFPSNSTLFTGLYPYQVSDSDEAVLVDQAVTLAEYFKQAGFKTAAFSAHPIISKRWNFDQGFDTFWGADGSQNKTFDEQVLDRSLVWLADNWEEKSFLVMYFYSPHEPYRPSEISNGLKTTLAKMRPIIAQGRVPLLPGIREPIIVDKISDPNGMRQCTLAEIDALHQLYYGCIQDDDRRIGKLLSVIGNDSETVIAITSDHGEEWLDHGGLAHKETLYQELLHIPIILHAPGKKGRAISAPVSNLDLPLTFLELAGIKPQAPLPGKSLLEIGDEDMRTLFSGRYHSEGFDKLKGLQPFQSERYAIRQNNRVLIHSLDPTYPVGGIWEYFDLSSDPTEQVPLPADPTSENLRLQLLAFEKAARQQTRQQGKPSAGEIQEKLKDMKNLGYLGK